MVAPAPRVNVWGSARARQNLQPAATMRIDPASGDDSNAGAPAAPLRTWAEFRRRFEGVAIAVDTTVQIVGALAEAIVGSFRLGAAGFLRVTGRTFETVLYTSAGTAVTTVAMNAAGNAVLVITDAAVPTGDWATGGPAGGSLIRKRIRWTSGACNGAVAWIMNNTLGATIIEVSTPILWNDALAGLYTLPGSPANGDTFVVEDLITATGVDLSLDSPDGSSTTGYFGSLRGSLDSLEIQNTGALGKGTIQTNGFGGLAFARGKFPSSMSLSTEGLILGGSLCSGNLVQVGTTYVLGCLCPSGLSAPSGNLILDAHTISNGAVFAPAPGGGLFYGAFGGQGGATWRSSGTGVSGSTGAVIDATSGLLWGTNNTTRGVDLPKSSFLRYGSTKPIITGGAGVDLRIWSKTPITWASLPAATSTTILIDRPTDLQISENAGIAAPGAAYVQAGGITLTPPAGRYLALVSCSATPDAAATLTIAIGVAGAAVTDTDTPVGGATEVATAKALAAEKIIDVTGAQAVTLLWKASAGGAMTFRRLVLVPLA